MKCPICGEEMLAGGLISAGISVGWVPKDEFDKKGLRRISYQEWHSIGNSSILLGQTKIPNAFLCKKCNKIMLSTNNFSRPTCTAYLCQNCKQVIIHYSADAK